jgi:D-alanine-D-alanine ligase-like ATP-grasp enzyme
MHVVFVEPSFPRNQMEFVRALHEVGATVSAIGEAPLEGLPRQLKEWLTLYEQVPSVVHQPSLEEAVRAIQAKAPVDRLEGSVEAHVTAIADVREACGIPGTSVRTTFLCRDKPAMKEVLREAGVACAQSTGAESAEEARAFAAEVGYPLVLKPLDAAGAAGTYRVDNDEELEQAIVASHLIHGKPAAIEEFIEGHEGFYDTLTANGEVVHDFISHYYPNVLEAMRTRWVSPQIITTNRMDAEAYEEVRKLGKRVIEVLGIETSATHMEWFFGPKGLKFSEIGCRPPGVGVWDLYGAANDFDMYTEWAKLIVHGKTDARASRRYAAGMIALRPDQDGTIVGYDGLEEVKRRYSDSILDMHVPPPGSGTQGVEGGYMANAYLRLRHPDFDELQRIMDSIGESVQVRAE